MSKHIWLDTSTYIAVSRNEGSGKTCKCADSTYHLLSASTKYDIDADSDQN